jgi:undecaprenyl-diphosphatase
MGALANRITDLDRRWLLGVARSRAPQWLDRGLRLITHLGGATVTIGCGLVLLPPLESRVLGWTMLVANASSHTVVQLLKRMATRPRPHFPDEGVTALVAHPDEFSLPSGHACAAMAVAMSLVLHHPGGAAGIALAVALAVGASRVYLRVHYVTDVLVGQLIGVAGAIMAVALAA